MGSDSKPSACNSKELDVKLASTIKPTLRNSSTLVLLQVPDIFITLDLITSSPLYRNTLTRLKLDVFITFDLITSSPLYTNTLTR
jgi:hypothetical protein